MSMDFENDGMYQRMIDAAIQGFLKRGYHGFSLQQCACDMEMPQFNLRLYVDDKLHLAHLAYNRIKRLADKSIRRHESPFWLFQGRTQALLPARLWESNDFELRSMILQYYKNWQHSFKHDVWKLNNPDNSTTCHDHWFYVWLGFWLMESMEN